jgi:hypothetical protein
MSAEPVIFESYCSLFQTSLDSIERSAAPVIFESRCSVFQTSLDSIERSAAPVIFSHSSAQALCNSTRNIPDMLLKKVVISLFFYYKIIKLFWNSCWFLSLAIFFSKHVKTENNS